MASSMPALKSSMAGPVNLCIKPIGFRVHTTHTARDTPKTTTERQRQDTDTDTQHRHRQRHTKDNKRDRDRHTDRHTDRHREQKIKKSQQENSSRFLYIKTTIWSTFSVSVGGTPAETPAKAQTAQAT